MKKKLLTLLLVIATAALGAAVFSSCSSHKNNTHKCTFGDWITVNSATCTQTGLQERYCLNTSCNKKEQNVIEIDASAHNLEPIKRNEASCTEDGNIAHNHCTSCNKNFDDNGTELSQTDVIIPKAHNLEPVKRNEANCTEDGNIAHNHCTSCNKNFDDNGTELSQADIIIHKAHVNFDLETLYCSACNKYIIKTAEQLKKFRDSVNNGNNYSGKTIELEDDIDLNNEEWIPIANVTRKETDDSKFFKGIFDGKNHTVSNVTSTNNADNACVGLFGVTANAVIKNLNVQGAFTNSVDTVAGLVGCDLSGAGEMTEITNCSVNAIISGDCVGGILGRAYGAGQTKIDGCTTSGTFTATANGKAGGIVCINNSNKDLTTVSNCLNTASVSGGKGGTGGIFGFANNNIKIEKCTNNGNVGSSDNADKYAAGILGYQQGTTNVIIEECENRGNICGMNAGGIFGVHGSNQEITITYCINSGNINGNIAGGIASTVSGRIADCTNTGAVNGGETADGTAGGIVGSISGNTDITITGCSGGTAAISAMYAGRLIGTVHNGLSVAYLSIDDTNNDGYENGLGTVGCVGAYTAYSTMVVTEGTLRGKVVSYGQAQGWIVISEQAQWTGYDETEEKTTWNFSYNTNDFEKTTATPIPLQPK